MKPKPDVGDGRLAGRRAGKRSADSRDEHGPDGAIRAVADTQVSRANFDPPILAHVQTELCHPKNVAVRAIPWPGLIWIGIARRQLGRIPLQQVNSPANRGPGGRRTFTGIGSRASGEKQNQSRHQHRGVSSSGWLGTSRNDQGGSDGQVRFHNIHGNHSTDNEASVPYAMVTAHRWF